MARTNPHVTALKKIARRLATARPPKACGHLFDAFLIVAPTGDREACARILRAMYERGLPVPAMPPTAFSTSVLDGYCAAAGLGDITKGRPAEGSLASGEALDARVRIGELNIRHRLVADAYSQGPPIDEHWAKLAAEAWRANNRWRWIQKLATPEKDGGNAATEPRALAELERYIADWQPKQRGPGYGSELLLAVDLALRHGRPELVAPWLAAQGHRFVSEAFLLQQGLCLPAFAAAAVRGELRALRPMATGEVTAAVDAIETALDALITAAATAKPTAVPKVQKRRVSCEYSQLHLEPETTAMPPRAYFQDERESAQGLSIFPECVGIATPSETAHVDVEISVATEKPALGPAVQAVAFPFRVAGPLVLRSVTSDGEDDPVTIPHGHYDVMACFFPKAASKADAKAGLRAWKLVLTFLPEGALDAPACLRLEEGEQPRQIFVNA